MLIPPETEAPMNISSIIQLFQTPTCLVLAVTLLVLACGFVLKNLHIKCNHFEINAKSKKEET